ncbi:nondiscriminating glutamyl-tRNA synthetase [Sedimentibacter acidaminivorans]|uniref:Glutamate--tRNA ligase n=1 Tax=Sedimentibacter acidaminivorans TaxID=913099 RepID=A0ABS4GI77_9FIRM|nr:glutamate--tRNA ligase [Sedimentibacter acidaminivorans]MBP1927397.1 nondiscriminating glutamyl-tRNA synthetase [Sedimentibacter acidaminivorans]
MSVRLRFAPSPTGYLHIGGLRTALYCYLYANKNGGNYILRIEDTDQSRFVEGAMENLIESLLWAGVKHDEGVFVENDKIVQKGEYGPYIQSERLEIYKNYIKQLLDSGHAYYCFCTKERLDLVRDKQRQENKTPMYDKHCMNLTKEEVESKIAAGEEYVIRLKVPKNEDITFTDLVKGTITINSSEVDDQVLIKSDGFPTYHFAVVVDDHLMGITHAVRGEEWLTSTPKQKLIYDYLGWNMPMYIHLPTVLNKDKKKLSKRQGDVATSDFKNKGYLPEALVNYLALVGWSPKDNQEIFSLDELVREFDFDRVSKTGGIFDIDKLNWVNNHYIKESNPERIAKLAIPAIIDSGLMTKEETEEKFEWLVQVTDALKERLNYVNEIVKHMSIFFGDTVEFETSEVEEIVKADHVKNLLEAFVEELNSIDEVTLEFAKGIFNVLKSKTGAKGKNLFMPVRCAVTGQQHGPEMDKILVALGKDKILNRLKYVINLL